MVCRGLPLNLKWLKPRTLYKVVEVKERGQLSDDTDAIVSLRGHPGWEAQMSRLRAQREYLETKLRRTKHKDIREVDLLQAGIMWLEYLEEDCRAATEAQSRYSEEVATTYEEAAFRKIDAFIERIGTDLQGQK